MSLPYENATSGKSATDELQKILRGFGATSFGLMEDFDKGYLIVQFEWRGRRVSVKASTKGYATAWLREHPWGPRHKRTKIEYERHAIEVGTTATHSILRDWLKGQVMAVETGLLSFEGAFLGQILLASGRTVLEEVGATKMLSITGGEL